MDDNTDTLIEQIFKYLPYGPQYYDEDTVTDQPMRQIAAELIREKALRLLDDEIPHGIAVTIEQMKERKSGICDIEASIICEKESHKGIIIGKGGSMLKKIGSEARHEIEQMMEMRVNLQLWVKVRKEWRDSELYMKNYGYECEGCLESAAGLPGLSEIEQLRCNYNKQERCATKNKKGEGQMRESITLLGMVLTAALPATMTGGWCF